MWSGPMPCANKIDGWVKRNDRRDIDIAAVIVRDDGTSLPVRVRNLSYEGCQLDAGTILRIGERVTLTLPRMGDIKTQIRWATVDGKAGIRFLPEELQVAGPHPPSGL